MLKLGFAVDSLSPSQLSYYLVRQINRFLGESKNANTDVVVFYEDIRAPRQMPICSTMHINEIWGFDGVLVATSVSTALKASGVPGPKLKLFYPYTLEWIRPQRTNYTDFSEAYTSRNLHIIARNIDHAQIIHNCFNKPSIGTMEDFNLTHLLEIINAQGVN